MLNWLARYVPAIGLIEREEDGSPGSLLDVGCGPHGLACVRRQRAFVGLDVAFDGPVAPSMLALKAPPGPLPFVDAAFETVLCLDTLEHVPPGARAGFVTELARVAARRVVIACPCDEAAAVDDLIRSIFARAGGPQPDWLDEHAEHGLPSRADVLAFGAGVDGFECRPAPTADGLLSILTVLADTMPELAGRAATAYAAQREEWERVLAAATFGSSPRAAIVLHRTAPAAAVVGPSCAAADVLPALRSPADGEPLEALTDRVWSTVPSGRVVARDAHGAWDLGPAATPAAAVPPGRPLAGARPRATLGLVADLGEPATWLPALAAYVCAPARREPVDLVIHASGADAATARQVLAACTRTLGNPRGELRLAGPGEPAAADADADAAALRERLGVPAPSPLPREATAIVDRARRAKALADAVTAIVDAGLFAAAPPPAAAGSPLVSVPIHTWRGVEALVARTIPSVLAGSYGDVEVVVCSDGPDPGARAAVEGLGDPRVRYLEVPERPVYAEHPYSRWLTAGTAAANAARAACRGAWITPLDHDDAYTSDHVGALLATARTAGADVVHGIALSEHPDRYWFPVGGPEPRLGSLTHGAVLHSRRLAHVRFDPDAWLLDEPGDWNLWRRLVATGARVAHHPAIVLTHFAEKSSVAADARIERRHLVDRATVDADALAHDVLATGARWLLDVDLPERG